MKVVSLYGNEQTLRSVTSLPPEIFYLFHHSRPKTARFRTEAVLFLDPILVLDPQTKFAKHRDNRISVSSLLELPEYYDFWFKSLEGYQPQQHPKFVKTNQFEMSDPAFEAKFAPEFKVFDDNLNRGTIASLADSKTKKDIVDMRDPLDMDETITKNVDGEQQSPEEQMLRTEAANIKDLQHLFEDLQWSAKIRSDLPPKTSLISDADLKEKEKKSTVRLFLESYLKALSTEFDDDESGVRSKAGNLVWTLYNVDAVMNRLSDGLLKQAMKISCKKGYNFFFSQEKALIRRWMDLQFLNLPFDDPRNWENLNHTNRLVYRLDQTFVTQASQIPFWIFSFSFLLWIMMSIMFASVTVLNPAISNPDHFFFQASFGGKTKNFFNFNLLRFFLKKKN